MTDTTALATKIEGRLDQAVAGQMELSGAAGGLSLANMGEVMEFAKMMALSDVAVPKHLRTNPGACLAVSVQAFEWQMSPFAVANKSYAVNDRLAYESQLVQAVILRRAPIVGRIKFAYEGEGPTRVCIASATTTDGEEVTYRSPKLSDIKVQNSPLWKSDPDQQLSYYCGRGLCRRHFPDVLLGVYDRDEIEGAEPLKDVTPKPSGLKDRLAGAGNGFSAQHVNEVTAAPAGTSPATSREPDTFEAGREGVRAFHAGEERVAPEDYEPAEQQAWLAAFDKEDAEAATGEDGNE